MNLDTTVAVRDLGAVGKGASGARIVSCEDGEEYVVKYKLSGMPRLFVNEFVGFCVAKILDCPIPSFKAVRFDRDFLEASLELKSQLVTVGLYPGSLKVNNAIDFTAEPANFSVDIDNSSSFSSIVVFDNWVANEDRNNTGNNIIQFEKGKRSLLIIDNGHILGGPNWSQVLLSDLSKRTSMQKGFEYITSRIKGGEQFEFPLRVIEKIPRDNIKDIVDYIPSEWFIDKKEMADLVTNTIESRKGLVRQIIMQNRDSFPNCKWS